MTESHPRPVPYAISLGVGTGSLLQPLNSSMIAVALVSIGTELQLDGGTSWLVSGLYLATAVAAPTAGRLADLYGARRVYFAGLVLVALGGIIGPLAPTLPGLIVARIILGLGTASQYPAAMAIIRARAARYREDASGALAVLGVCAQVSVAFGPTLGGLLVSGLGWRAIFWVNVPLVVVSALWVWRATEPDPPRTHPPEPGISHDTVWQRLDVLGLLAFAGALSGLMLFLLSLSSGLQWWWLLLCLLLGAAFVRRERRARYPFFDLGLFARQPRLAVIFGRQLLVATAFYAVFYVLPQWLEGVRRFTPEQAGLVILPIAGVGVVATITATALIRRAGVLPPLIVGTVGLIVSGLLIALVLQTRTPIWGLVVVALLLGVPNGFNNMGNQNELYDVAGADVGAASGLLRTMQYVGANLSAVLIEVLMHGPVSDAGLHRVGFGIATVAAVLLVLTLARPPGRSAARGGTPRP